MTLIEHTTSVPRGRRPQTEATAAVDKYVGARIRQARNAEGMGMEELARRLGVSYQQVQKYEIGCNRVSIGRLLQISRIFQRPLNFFVEDMIESDSVPNEVADARRSGLELVRAMTKIRSPNVRRAVMIMIRGLAGESEDEGSPG